MFLPMVLAFRDTLQVVLETFCLVGESWPDRALGAELPGEFDLDHEPTPTRDRAFVTMIKPISRKQAKNGIVRKSNDPSDWPGSMCDERFA
jgi:hypothetical protein